jgi:hypothetical protein
MRTRIFTLLSLLLITSTSLFVSAQKDVTTFLGIPVDGTKSEMKKKLIAKGFKPKTEDGVEYLEGEFNGKDVQIYIVTNNNKVYRLMLADKLLQDEANIKIRFNTLVGQFERNKRYSQGIDEKDQRIPDDEDISYEMTVHKKVFEAAFYQKPDDEKVDTVALRENILQAIYAQYTPEQLENADDDMKRDMMISALIVAEELLRKKSVWFRIADYNGKYGINMFYDNEYNHADGEDL